MPIWSALKFILSSLLSFPTLESTSHHVDVCCIESRLFVYATAIGEGA